MAAWPAVFGRPAAVIFGTTNNVAVNGYDSLTDFICTDHGRQEINISPERVETAGRMIDGTYRSHFVTKKDEISVAWIDVPSRATDAGSIKYTADGYKGGMEILDYLDSIGGATFYLKLTKDDLSLSSAPLQSPEKLYKVMVKSYSHTVKRRSGKFDMIDLDVVLVEV